LRTIVGSNPLALSGMLVLKLLPIFLAGPIAGVAADRFSRRGIMIGSDLIRAALALALIATPFLPRPIGTAYLLILLQVVASAFFEPARSAALPQLVPDRYLSAANALGAMSWSVVFALGAALGGLVTDLLGWRVALTIDALTYVVSALLVAKIRLRRRARTTSENVDWQTLSGLRDIKEGFRFIAGRPDIATVLGVKAGWGLAGAITLFLTLFGERDYAIDGRPDLGVSVLYVARAVGTGIGPWLARHLLPDESPRTMRRLIAIAFVWPALWYLVFSWVTSAPAAATTVVIAHFGGSVLWVYTTILLQRMTPNAYLGRVMAADIGLATLSISLSIGLYGALAAAPAGDLRQLVRWMSISLLIPTLAWLVASKRWPPGRRAENAETLERDF
jgi:hypothetical protein